MRRRENGPAIQSSALGSRFQVSLNIQFLLGRSFTCSLELIGQTNHIEPFSDQHIPFHLGYYLSSVQPKTGTLRSCSETTLRTVVMLYMNEAPNQTATTALDETNFPLRRPGRQPSTKLATYTLDIDYQVPVPLQHMS